MRFVPARGYAEVAPVRAESAMLTETKNYIENGTVISLGAQVESVKEGQTIWFDAWRSHCTPKDMVGNPATPDGIERWVVQINEDADTWFGSYEPE